MRSGVIAQKVGMTRVFTETGEHIPVTVLKLGNCQVLGHRTTEKNGYVALQLGSGTRKTVYLPKAERGQFAVSKVEPKRKVTEFRVSEDALIPVGAEIQADHFVVGQFVDVTGTSVGKGFAGGMKRWNFGGLRATHGVSVSHRSIGSTGGRQDPGKTFKNKKMPGHMGVERVTTLNLKVVQTDVERGLILVEGAVPGAKGGWITLRDAVKKKLPKDAPKPGKFRLPEAAAAASKAEATPADEGKAADKEGAQHGTQGRVARRQGGGFGRTAGRDLRPRAEGGHPPSLRALAARQASARHARRQEPRRDPSYRQEDVPAEGHRLRPPRLCAGQSLPRRRPLVRAHAAQPCDRSAEEGARARSQARLVRQGQGRRHHRAREGDREEWQDRRTAKELHQARTHERAHHRRRRARSQFRPGRAQYPEHRRAPGAGHQRLRHPATADIGADQVGAGSIGGAFQMSTTDPRYYDVIISPVITEKATLASARKQAMLKVARRATKPQIKEAVEKLFDVKVKSVNTHVRKGKIKAFKGTIGEQSEVKRAIVTLEEGHKIDVTTGL